MRVLDKREWEWWMTRVSVSNTYSYSHASNDLLHLLSTSSRPLQSITSRPVYHSPPSPARSRCPPVRPCRWRQKRAWPGRGRHSGPPSRPIDGCARRGSRCGETGPRARHGSPGVDVGGGGGGDKGGSERICGITSHHLTSTITRCMACRLCSQSLQHLSFKSYNPVTLTSTVTRCIACSWSACLCSCAICASLCPSISWSLPTSISTRLSSSLGPRGRQGRFE